MIKTPSATLALSPFALLFVVAALDFVVVLYHTWRPQPSPRFWTISPHGSDQEIRVQEGIAPNQLVRVARQIVQDAE